MLDAFGITAEPVVLPGGRGGTWRADDLVLKPVDFAPETRWRSDALAALPASAAFRVAPPVRSTSGDRVGGVPVRRGRAARQPTGRRGAGRHRVPRRAGPHNVPPTLVDRWSHPPAWDQVLLRALIYRITTLDRAHGEWTADHLAAHRPVIDLVVSRLGGSPR